jgi:hypothetical protein
LVAQTLVAQTLVDCDLIAASPRETNRAAWFFHKFQRESDMRGCISFSAFFWRNRMLRSLLMSVGMVAAVAASTCVVAPVSVQAAETGMASMHSWRKVGKKTCMVDHEHSGSGSGVNRKVAELEAIRSWSGFTDLEYGSSWANFNNAIGKSMRCGGGMGGVQCDVVATACRPW